MALPSTILPNQLAFVENRQILDASLVENEMIAKWSQNKKEEVVLKLDLEKASDKVDWYFLDTILHIKCFGPLWHIWIRDCISSSNFSVIIVARPWGKIIPSRGIKQGNPLSPFLFIYLGS